MPIKTSSQHGAAGDSGSAPPASERFDRPAVAIVAGAHFIHDLYPAFIAPLVPLLMEKHAMTYAIASGLMTLNRWPGVVQPILGYWADRCDSRILMVLGPVVTALSVCLLGLAPSYATIAALLLIGGVSSAAFHPTAGAMVTRASGRDWGRGTSFFMTGGELGRALGPVFIATVVVTVGLTNIWIAAIPAVAIAGLVYFQLGNRRAPIGHAAPPTGLREILRTRWRVLLLLVLIIVFRSFVIAGFQNRSAAAGLRRVARTVRWAGPTGAGAGAAAQQQKHGDQHRHVPRLRRTGVRGHRHRACCRPDRHPIGTCLERAGLDALAAVHAADSRDAAGPRRGTVMAPAMPVFEPDRQPV